MAKVSSPYPRCTECKNRVPQVIDRVINRKRHQLCFSCARKAGWFDEDGETFLNVQGQLFKEDKE